MWSGFITGFAEKSVSLIEERDKEIRAGINRRIEDMYKQASVAKKQAEERRETLTSLANQLMGVGFSKAEAQLLIDNPEQAESIVKLVEATPNKMADPETKRKLFAPAQERLAGVSGEKLIDKINKISTPQRSSVPTVLPTEMRGAFGLPSGAEDYVKTLGLKEEDLATELPAREIAKPLGLDMSVFADEKKAPTKAEVLASFAKKINEAASEDQVRELQRERDRYIKLGFPKDDDQEKALTFSNTTTGLQKAISQAFTANSQKLGNSTFSIADDGTIRFAPGTAEHSQFFRNMVRKTIKDTTERFTDSEGRLPEPIAAAVNFMGSAYGIRVGRDRKLIVGEIEAPETPPAQPKTRGGSKPAASSTKPTLQQFMIRAREANPGATDAELEKYYNDKYGNK